jgi:hypothetical protein
VKKCKPKILWAKKTSILAPCPLALQPFGNLRHIVEYRSSSKSTRKIEFTTHFEQKFTMGSYGATI